MNENLYLIGIILKKTNNEIKIPKIPKRMEIVPSYKFK